MNVYAESNFVLELAFAQQEEASCLAFLELAESGAITLILPAWSMGEPYETLVRRSKTRAELHRALSGQIHELSRSKPYHESANELRLLTGLLLRSGEEEKRRLDTALNRILGCAQIAALNSATLRSSLGLQSTRSLSPQDSMVYASILEHLSQNTAATSCFLTKDKDFLNPDIESELKTLGCQLMTTFSGGLAYTRNQLA